MPFTDRTIDIVNYHTTRSGEWWRQPWDVFRQNLGPAGGRPQINDEPMGSDVRDQPGRRASDGALFRAGAWISATAGGYFTFHCELGLTATPGAQPGQEFLKAYADFFRSVEMRGMTATTDFIRASGARETYGCRRGDAEAVVYLRAGDLSRPLDLRLGPGASYDVRVVNPSSGATIGTAAVNGGDFSVGLGNPAADVAVHLKKR